MNKKYFTTTEVCEFFSISKSTLYRRKKNPSFPKPAITSERIIRFEKELIEKWFKEQEKTNS